MSLKSELCHGTVLTLSAVIIPVSDQMTQTNCHQSQWQTAGRFPLDRLFLANGSHLDFWHTGTNDTVIVITQSLITCHYVLSRSKASITTRTGVTCSLGTQRRTESPSWPNTVKYRPTIFPEYHFMLGAPRPVLDILCLIQIRGPQTIFSITSKK